MVMGCNDDLLADEHIICTAASCTTNCLAPVVKVSRLVHFRERAVELRALAHLFAANSMSIPRSFSPKHIVLGHEMSIQCV